MCHCRSRESSVIVPPWLCGYFVGQNFFCGYFVDSNIFLLDILWVCNYYSRGYFVGPKLFHVGISSVQIFFRGFFVGPKIFLGGILWGNIVI